MRRSRHNAAAAFIALVTALLTACHTETVYHSYSHTPSVGWDRGDTLVIRPLRIDSTDEYTEELTLRTSNDFAYDRLCVVVEHIVLPRGRTTYDTVTLNTSEQAEEIESRGVSRHQFSATLPPRYYVKGDSIITYIHHNMKRQTIQGVSDVGLKISHEQ